MALRCEVNTLAYPKAALFGFCVAVLAFNVLSVVKACCARHGEEKIDDVLSTYYLTEEIAVTTRHDDSDSREAMASVRNHDAGPVRQAL